MDLTLRHSIGSWNWDSGLPIFSLNENPNLENEEKEPEIIRADTETEQGSEKTKWSKIKLRNKALRLFSRDYQTLIEEVTNSFKTIAFLHSWWFLTIVLRSNFFIQSLFMLQENEPNEERKPEMIKTDADTVKELVEIKFLAKKRNIRFRTPSQRLFTMNSEVRTGYSCTVQAT